MSTILVRAVTVQTAAFRTLVEALKGILVEMNLTFDKNGIRMTTMDNMKMVLTHVRLNGKWNSYECNQESLTIGLSTESLYRIVKSSTNSDTLTLQVDTSDPNVLQINFENAKKNKISRNRLMLLDRDDANVIMPEVNFSMFFTLSSDDFQKMCRDMTLLNTNTISIKKIGSALTFGCKGQIADREIILNDQGDASTNSEIFSGEFSLPHIVTFTKCTNLSINAELYLRNDWYLMLKYTVGDLGDITLCLMPIPTKNTSNV